MSDMSNDRAPIPAETGEHLPSDTEGHLSSLAQTPDAMASGAEDTEGHLRSLAQPPDPEDSEDTDDTEGHLRSL